MQLTDALFLTTLVAIVFFFMGYSFAGWRIQDQQLLTGSGYFPPAKNPAAGQSDRLQAWVSLQTKPFALADAALGIGFPDEKMSADVVTRLGIALKKLGCKRFFDAQGKWLYSPPVRDEQEAPTIKVPRGYVFIGTTNEADYAAPSNDRTSRAPYSKTFYSCSCNAVLKDDCHCESKRSYTPSASSGVALSSNTD